MPSDSAPSLQEMLPPGFTVKGRVKHAPEKDDPRFVVVTAPAGLLPNGKDGAFDQLMRTVSPRRVYIETGNPNNEYVLKLA